MGHDSALRPAQVCSHDDVRPFRVWVQVEPTFGILGRSVLEVLRPGGAGDDQNSPRSAHGAGECRLQRRAEHLEVPSRLVGLIRAEIGAEQEMLARHLVPGRSAPRRALEVPAASACRGEEGCDRDRPPDARAAKHSTRSVAPQAETYKACASRPLGAPRSAGRGRAARHDEAACEDRLLRRAEVTELEVGRPQASYLIPVARGAMATAAVVTADASHRARPVTSLVGVVLVVGPASGDARGLRAALCEEVTWRALASAHWRFQPSRSPLAQR